MSLEDKKALREKNKQKRKDRRANRIEKLKEFIEEVKKAPELPEKEPDYVEKFEKYWPVVKAGLLYMEAMRITGKKTDAKIRTIVDLGDDVATKGEDDSAFREKLEKIWKLIRLILIGVKIFSDDEKDEKIDKFIEIGDWFSGYAE